MLCMEMIIHKSSAFLTHVRLEQACRLYEGVDYMLAFMVMHLLNIHQLENLKRSYEAQLSALRRELEQKQRDQSERDFSTSYQMEPQAAQPPPPSSSSSSPAPSSPSPHSQDGEADQSLHSENSTESEVFELQVTVPDFETKFPEVSEAWNIMTNIMIFQRELCFLPITLEIYFYFTD